MNAFEVIKTVRLTEEGDVSQSERFNQYTVIADRQARTRFKSARQCRSCSRSR